MGTLNTTPGWQVCCRTDQDAPGEGLPSHMTAGEDPGTLARFPLQSPGWLQYLRPTGAWPGPGGAVDINTVKTLHAAPSAPPVPP